MSKTRSYVLNDPLLRKSHRHAEIDKTIQICPTCRGKCKILDAATHEIVVCPTCEGLGVR